MNTIIFQENTRAQDVSRDNALPEQSVARETSLHHNWNKKIQGWPEHMWKLATIIFIPAGDTVYGQKREQVLALRVQILRGERRMLVFQGAIAHPAVSDDVIDTYVAAP